MSDAEGEWLEKALRSQDIGRKIADLLNELAKVAPDAVQAQVYGPGFSINGMGGDFHIDSLLSTNDLRAISHDWL
jgi:hypothetical protein